MAAQDFDALETHMRDQFVATLRANGVKPEAMAMAALLFDEAADPIERDTATLVPTSVVASYLRDLAGDYRDAARRLA